MGLTSPDLNIKGKARGLDGAHYPALCHGADVAAVAICLWRHYVPPGLRSTVARRLGVPEDVAEGIIALWAGLHDVGKVEPHMQRKLGARLSSRYPPAERAAVPHGDVSCYWLTFALGEAGYPPPDADDPLSRLVAQMLGGHHGRYPPQLALRGDPRTNAQLDDDAWDEERFAYLAALRDLLDNPPPPSSFDPDLAVLITGLVVLADWLASQEHFILERIPANLDDFDLRAHFQASLERAPRLITEAGLDPLHTPAASFSESFPHIDTPHPLQNSIARHLPGLVDDRPGLLIVTAPTGEGKTETALFSADHMADACGRPGRAFLMPTMATTNSMYDRVRAYVKRRADTPAPLMKLHSMAWLDQEAMPSTPRPGSEVLTTPHAESAFTPTQWLYSSQRGLLASWGIATIDQALLGVLPTRFNAVRLFALACSTVVVDEAHAVDTYMQTELERLLAWLGRFEVPVVMLSATLHRSVADAYARAYTEGLGVKQPRRRVRRKGREPVVDHLNYPGWVYVTAQENQPVVTYNPEPITITERPPLTITPTTVPLRKRESPHRRRPDLVADRAAALSGLLAPVFTTGGTAAVVCTTVAEAQETYELVRQLRVDAGADATELLLLHARFPQRQRGLITEDLVRRLGREGAADRPKSAIVVATAIIEQSLDIDVDLMITDLAPLALLLQRAGRCWRHEHWRTIGEHGPRFQRGPFTEPRVCVLIPERGEKAPFPGAWSAIHSTSLLVRTANLLDDHGTTVRIPEDVQGLVERVHDDSELAAEEKLEWERMAKNAAERQRGQRATVPFPDALQDDLFPMTEGDLPDEEFTTRLGADSVRVVCCFQDANGRLWADQDATEPLPGAEPDRTTRLTRAEAKAVMSLSIPVPGGQWANQIGDDATIPDTWHAWGPLKRLTLIRHPLTAPGHPTPATLGGRTWLLDPDLGLQADI